MWNFKNLTNFKNWWNQWCIEFEECVKYKIELLYKSRAFTKCKAYRNGDLKIKKMSQSIPVYTKKLNKVVYHLATFNEPLAD